VTTSKLARLRLRRTALVLGIFVVAVFSGPSAKNNKRAGVTPPDIRNLMALYGADAVSIDRNARDFKLLDQVDWKSRPGSASQTAVLFGDPSKPGLYVTLLKRGPDDWSQPHSHPNDRFITVLKGTMLIGTEPRLIATNAVIGPGSIVGCRPSDALRRHRAGWRHHRVHRHGSDGERVEAAPAGSIAPSAAEKAVRAAPRGRDCN
jgi:hypothetical protein